MTGPTVQQVDEFLQYDDGRYPNWQEIRFHKLGGFEFVEEIEGDNRRWSRANTRIIKHIPSGTYYSFEYEEPLTETSGEYEYYGSVKIVERHTKVVEVTEWLPVKS